MHSPNTVFNALLTQIRFTIVQATAVVNKGSEEPGYLVTYTHSDIEAFFKQLASRVALLLEHNSSFKFYAIGWKNKMYPIGIIEILLELFTDVELLTWGEKMKAAIDKKDVQHPSIPAPNAFTKDTQWSPLIICFEPVDEEDLTDNFEWMVYLTPLQNIGYQYDSGMVYDELKALLVNSMSFK